MGDQANNPSSSLSAKTLGFPTGADKVGLLPLAGEMEASSWDLLLERFKKIYLAENKESGVEQGEEAAVATASEGLDPRGSGVVSTAPTVEEIQLKLESVRLRKKILMKMPKAGIPESDDSKGLQVPEIKWADSENFIVLEMSLPILHPNLYFIDLEGNRFSFRTYQGVPYEAEFNIGAPVIHGEKLETWVLPDREKGKIRVKIFKIFPKPWDYLIESKEKRTHKWLKRVESIEFEDKKSKEKAKKLDKATPDRAGAKSRPRKN